MPTTKANLHEITPCITLHSYPLSARLKLRVESGGYVGSQVEDVEAI